MFTDVKASILEGLDHCITAPISINRNLLIDDHEVSFSRSMTEKKEAPRHDLKLDRLSEREKVENRIMHCEFPYYFLCEIGIDYTSKTCITNMILSSLFHADYVDLKCCLCSIYMERHILCFMAFYNAFTSMLKSLKKNNGIVTSSLSLSSYIMATMVEATRYPPHLIHQQYCKLLMFYLLCYSF